MPITFNAVNPNNIIHYCHHGTNVITIYDKIAQTKRNVQSNRSIPNGSHSISFNDKIFIMGGSPPSKDVYEVVVNTCCCNLKTPNIIEKYGHGICSTTDSIFSIGGCNSSHLADCERYDVGLDKWDNIPKMNQVRRDAAVFVYDSKIIYALGGSNGSYDTNTVERINLMNADKWEYVNVVSPFSVRRKQVK